MSGTPLEIPLIPSTAQSFTIMLVGVSYTMTVHWCVPSASWILDIADQNAVPMVLGVPLVTGVDLLEAYAYLEIGGQLIVQTDGDVDAVPTFANLGDTSHLYFVPDE